LALKNWIGRASSQDLVFHRFLLKNQYTPAQAAIVIQLLHGLADSDREQPETYVALIEYLRHSKLLIRQLAKDQLEQWIAAGRKIGYDPAASESEREGAYQKWKKLIPDAKLRMRDSQGDK
jgi:hypothetical protein